MHKLSNPETMSTPPDYFDINKQSWNSRVDSHLKSDFYDMKGFMAGKSSLNGFELELLGDVRGKKILHLQCHFGQDTLSLARMGAIVTGIDLSDKAIETANNLASELQLDARFICCNIFDLPEVLDETFDIVFTSYGTICWLPDLAPWAKLIAAFLQPKGKFVFAEFHPVVWMFDNKFQSIGYNYFNVEPIFEEESGTYADRDADLKLQSVCWNHSMADVITNLLQNGLEITALKEYDYSPYDCFDETIQFEPGKYRIKHLDNKIPMVYTVQAIKK